MTDRFQMPRLPRARRQIGKGQQTRQPDAQDVLSQYGQLGAGVSRLIGLSDATGSMAPVWQSTREQIKEMIGRASELGRCEMNWVAYRDYGDGPGLLEASGWQDGAAPLTSFVNDISCYGGDDREEAVERALEYAAADQRATRVVLIGDAPPHPQRDYLDQARRLARQRRPVYSFVVGGAHDTVATFAEISRITGGVSTRLRSAQDLIDVVVLTMADDAGGSAGVHAYLERHKERLSSGATTFARRLLTAGGS